MDKRIFLILLIIIGVRHFSKGQDTLDNSKLKTEILKVFIDTNCSIWVNKKIYSFNALNKLLRKKDNKRTQVLFAKQIPVMPKRKQKQLQTSVAVPDLFVEYGFEWTLFKDSTYTK